MTGIALAFLEASVVSLCAAGVIWAALALAARLWPVLAAHRSVWLLAQAAVAGAFVLALLPQSAQLSVVPHIELQQAPVQPARPIALTYEGHDEAPETFWAESLALAWLALYGTGLLVALARRVRAQRRLAALLADATILDAGALRAHPGFRTRPALTVRETDAAVAPMLAGLLQPCLLLPRHLRSFSAEQQQLIVAHELAHWRRRDAIWLHASLLLQTLFWFNPLLRSMGRTLNWAQELGCDRTVLQGRPNAQRKEYALALVAQLQLHQTSLGALGFGQAGQGSMLERVRLIRDQGMQRLGSAGRLAVLAGLSCVLGASLLLQPAFAWRAAPAMPVAAAAGLWQMPLAQVRVSSFYGAARVGQPHRGIDFAAPTGRPVLATASGTVIESCDLLAGAPQYGQVVIIEHAGQMRSMYAHLSLRKVQAGQRVKAGDVIGQVGESGQASGPHLHLEAFHGEERIDPQRMLARLDSYATARALRKRPAQH